MLQEPLPDWVRSLFDRVASLGLFPAPPNHLLVNEYESGQGIMPHTDGPLYTPVVATLTLQSHALLELQTGVGEPVHGSLLLQPRALSILRDGLYGELHGIAERTHDTLDESVANVAQCPGVSMGDTLARGTRVSLTIRHVPNARPMPALSTLLRK
jgi:alkylated DNA repair protein alkB homolog 6